MKKLRRYSIFVLAAMLLVGCGVKKRTVSGEGLPVSGPTWHTCLIQSARATVNRDGETMSSLVTMQTVHDSMLVISVMPILGMEMMRLEATPTELTAIDKMHGQYTQATFAELNRKLTPTLNWDILQQVCTAELPTGKDKARLIYAFGDETIELIIDYTPRKLDVPVRVYNLPIGKYQRIDISRWL